MKIVVSYLAAVLLGFLCLLPAAPVVAAEKQENSGADVSLHWPDRRPIGRIFLSRVRSGWEKNPRGYLNDPKVDVSTPEGVAAFRQKLIAKAETAVAYLKEMNGQGVVVWDIEGQEMPHAISYIGDPRVLPEIAPEMDAVADDFFAVFRNAGLRTGITIRPTRVVRNPDGKWPWKHEKVYDPVREMSEKIKYARKRWGCTIFYIDSNVSRQVLGDYPWVLPSHMMEKLFRQFPDVLLIPEWETEEYYQYTAPYKDWWDGFSTPEGARKRFPGSFSVFVAKSQNVSDHYHAVLAALEHGDTTWLDAGFPKALDNQVVGMLYRELNLRKTTADGGVSPEYKESSELSRQAVVDDIDRLEFFLGHPDILVQRNAMEGLGRVPDKRATRLLIDILYDKNRLPIPFAITALGQQGDAAVQDLKKLVLAADSPKGVQLKAIRALGKTKSAAANEFLIELLESDSGTNQARFILRSLKELKNPKSVKYMLRMLEKPDMQYRALVIDVLQEIGNPEAIAGLLVYINSDDRLLRNRSRGALKFVVDNLFEEMLEGR